MEVRPIKDVVNVIFGIIPNDKLNDKARSDIQSLIESPLPLAPEEQVLLYPKVKTILVAELIFSAKEDWYMEFLDVWIDIKDYRSYL
jgi:hypothetical protein